MIVTASLVDNLWYTCGSDPMTGKIESVYQALTKFQADCIKAEGAKGYFVQQCPGFSSFEKGQQEIVDYIEDMELDYACQGFCSKGARPLFDPENLGEACAWA